MPSLQAPHTFSRVRVIPPISSATSPVCQHDQRSIRLTVCGRYQQDPEHSPTESWARTRTFPQRRYRKMGCSCVDRIGRMALGKKVFGGRSIQGYSKLCVSKFQRRTRSRFKLVCRHRRSNRPYNPTVQDSLRGRIQTQLDRADGRAR